jgi:hypothetical protein
VNAATKVAANVADRETRCDSGLPKQLGWEISQKVLEAAANPRIDQE